MLDNGGTALRGELSVSAVLSHEVLEAHLDPRVQMWAQDQAGAMWVLEVCDPVEDQAYDIKISGHDVSVPNFVLPTWLDSQSTGERLDHLGTLKKPFTLTKGGYAVKYMDGQAQDVYGEKFAEWKLPGKQHELARKTRRAG